MGDVSETMAAKHIEMCTPQTTKSFNPESSSHNLKVQGKSKSGEINNHK